MGHNMEYTYSSCQNCDGQTPAALQDFHSLKAEKHKTSSNASY